ncbi:hypothetical protein ATKI12_3987 [Kitasatospora sp. Ki12]
MSGQGVANLIAPLFGGVAATGAADRHRLPGAGKREVPNSLVAFGYRAGRRGSPVAVGPNALGPHGAPASAPAPGRTCR